MFREVFRELFRGVFDEVFTEVFSVLFSVSSRIASRAADDCAFSAACCAGGLPAEAAVERDSALASREAADVGCDAAPGLPAPALGAFRPARVVAKAVTIDWTSRMMSSRLSPFCGSADIDSMNSITGPRSAGTDAVGGAEAGGGATIGRCTLMNSSSGTHAWASAWLTLSLA